MPKHGGTVETASGELKKGETINEDKQITEIRSLKNKIDEAILVDRDFIMVSNGDIRHIGPVNYMRDNHAMWAKHRQHIRNKLDHTGPEINGSSWLQK